MEENKTYIIVKPKNYDAGYPDGSDMFELIGISKDGSKMYYYYYDDVEKLTEIDLRKKENIRMINTNDL